MLRTDIHRPSVIRPEDYEFVACKYIGCKELDIGECFANADALKYIEQHRAMTGDRYSGHQHGGTCHVCGALAMYLAVYYHPATNSYIQMGEDCAQKMDMGDVEAFNPLRRAIANAKDAKAGKLKAQAVLSDAGLSRAWEVHQKTQFIDGSPEGIITDIVDKLVRYGSISEKQEALIGKLLYRIDHQAEIEAQRQREREAAAPCPNGRHTVTGEVLKTEERYSKYGEVLKMLVKTDGGFLVWGTVPACLEIIEETQREGTDTWTEQRGLRRGDRVEFTANLTRSDRDEKFGFFQRPTKARLLDTVAV